jgi:hypothetical protein
MKKKPESKFVKILETDSLTDIAMIKSVLDGSGIRYYIQGENVRYLRPVDSAVLMVQDEDVKKAVALIKPLKLNYGAIYFDQNPRS